MSCQSGEGSGNDISATYDRYHGTGLYARRYPAPNRACLRSIVETVREAGNRVLDFGCGNGRYAAPLLQSTDARVLGYDVSLVAVEELALRCAPFRRDGRLRMVGGDLGALAEAAGPERFDVAIVMFGVLAHIPNRRGRVATLSVIHGMLRPDGRLLVSVPNARRRFPAEQKAARPLIAAGRLEPGDVLYTRPTVDEPLELYYHLYQPGELESEMAEAGFRPMDTVAESVLPERAVVTWPILRAADRLLRAVLPLSLAYGFLTVAAAGDRPEQPSGAATAAVPEMA